MHKNNTPFYLLGSLLLLVFLTFSCASTNYGFHIPKKSRDQFVKIVQKIEAILCKDDKNCLSKKTSISGSGVVVKHNLHGSFVLTAGHVCQLELPKSIIAEAIMQEALIREIHYDMKVVNLVQSKYSADIVAIDMNSDLCLLFIKGYWNKEGAVNLSSVEPFKGERVYNVAAPMGIFYQDVVPLLEGFYMSRNGKKAYYSIPAMGGSSGSPIFNIRGDLVGMIHSVNVYFPVISVSPTFDNLKLFLEKSIEAHEKKQEFTEPDLFEELGKKLDQILK
tara:strand:- start:6 stop:836 length:831 start_codon:yes stop_codon:yes gene_type:complete